MKKVLLSAGAGLIMAAVPVSQAFAWHYQLTGEGTCQENGSFKITWTVDNSSENQPLDIVWSSNTAVIPAGTVVSANSSQDFYQTVSGTTASNYSLTIKGNWAGDQTKQEHYATVTMEAACEQPQPPVTPPVTPPSGGRGGGMPTPTPITTPAAPVAQPTAQVVAPKGAVNAGQDSKTTSFNAASALGLAGSLPILGLGVRRLAKRSR